MTYLPDLPDIDADFSEFKPDEHLGSRSRNSDFLTGSLEAIRQENEPFLTRLEALAVCAIASNNWDAFYAHVVDFQNEHDLHDETLVAIGEDNELS